MFFQRNRLLTILLAIGVIGAAWALSFRYQAEESNRAVEISVDYSEVAKLAGAANVTVDEALTRFKEAGVTSLSLQQPEVSDLVSQGQIRISNNASDNNTIVTGSSPDVYQSLVDSNIPFQIVRKPSPGNEQSAWTLEAKTSSEYILSMPTAFPEEAFDAAKKAGLAVVARLCNYPGVTKASIEKTLSQLEFKGVHKVIFAGDEVLGFRAAIDDVADALKEHKMVFGSVEFTKQKGDARLSEKMLPDVIRVHSITAAEMGTLDRPTAIERFTKAAKERNIRLLYVRMFDFGDADLLQSNIDYVKSISAGLKADRIEIKPAHTFSDPGVPLPASAMMAIGVAAGTILLLLSIIKLSPKVIWLTFILIALIYVGLVLSGMALGLKLVGLISAIVFPTLAIIAAVCDTPEQSTQAPLRPLMWKAAGRFMGVIAVSAAGGMIIAGMLAKLRFMLRVDQFAGIKLAHIMPILIVAFVLAVGIGWGAATWREQLDKINAGIRKLGAQPILIWHSMIALVILVMLGILLARSGNESGVGVSTLELKFRSILNTVFFVRPRTKEFLVGHPMLFLGIVAALGGRRGWAALLLVLGTIGEVSVVNTFCHLHTPVATSILRVAIGSVLGLIIGIVLLVLSSRFGENSRKTAKQPLEREKVGVEK